MSSVHSSAWHVAIFIRRCCKCGEAIQPRARYWGTAHQPLRIVCFGCKTGHPAEVKV